LHKTTLDGFLSKSVIEGLASTASGTVAPFSAESNGGDSEYPTKSGGVFGV